MGMPTAELKVGQVWLAGWLHHRVVKQLTETIPLVFTLAGGV